MNSSRPESHPTDIPSSHSSMDLPPQAPLSWPLAQPTISPQLPVGHGIQPRSSSQIESRATVPHIQVEPMHPRPYSFPNPYPLATFPHTRSISPQGIALFPRRTEHGLFPYPAFSTPAPPLRASVSCPSSARGPKISPRSSSAPPTASYSGPGVTVAVPHFRYLNNLESTPNRDWNQKRPAVHKSRYSLQAHRPSHFPLPRTRRGLLRILSMIAGPLLGILVLLSLPSLIGLIIAFVAIPNRPRIQVLLVVLCSSVLGSAVIGGVIWLIKSRTTSFSGESSQVPHSRITANHSPRLPMPNTILETQRGRPRRRGEVRRRQLSNTTPPRHGIDKPSPIRIRRIFTTDGEGLPCWCKDRPRMRVLVTRR